MTDKKIGIVDSFDGYVGYIEYSNEEYLFTYDDIKNNEKLSVNDRVSFNEEVRMYQDQPKKLAKFVAKVK